MSLVYLDTSALLKLCVLETGSDLAVAVWKGADALVTSRIADAEVRSVLASAERIGRIDAAPAAQARDRWAELWPGLAKVEVVGAVTDRAAELVDRRPLRAGDAIHLASALLLAEARPLFVAWDRRLATAGRAEGLRVLPPALA
ncbi:type II toxin-antitoxin system VapC family toxin [Demequina lignilytica]|uniref:Ribonuclease VapC n=1 Tax=Demequina lignilytica TaxID=3051663 RepID=A0AB35MK82_9MICO|nr:type II toxin-antitoxin system VapC family toxin [Demequina sp. SYSU T0a273]MDN4484244.1 type II toxin-antitoxin system VapC family toxin [Demequina sp. SYSU T0a273]